MSALTDRITEVLWDHVRIKYIDGTPFCECGAEWSIKKGHAAHVAERIEAELQLTEETTRDILTDKPLRRWVSAWVFPGRR